MSIIITLLVALAAMGISGAAYPRPVSYLAGGVTGAALLIVAGLLVRDAEYFAAVLMLALAAVPFAWSVAGALAHGDRKRDEHERLTPLPLPVLVEERNDIGGHTITIEDGPGGRLLVERHDGLLIKIVRREADLLPGESIYMAARAAAWTYKARYVSSLDGTSWAAQHALAVDNILGGAK